MLTRSGLGALITALVAILCGWWFRYEELVVTGAIMLALLSVALIVTRLGTSPAIERHFTAARVARGDDLRLVYRIENLTRRRSSRFIITDRCDGAELNVAISPLRPRQRIDVGGSLATRRRGVFPVGPCRTVRTDVLGLAVGQRSVPVHGSIIVHPRVHVLHGPYGAHHSTDDDANIRTATADPLNGFVSLREYVDGDDPRLIHWPTSARMTTLMVREHVELRRPEFTVVLDTSQASSTAEDFEEVVDVAASLAVDALAKGIGVHLRTTDPDHPGPTHSMRSDGQILDFLTNSTLTPPQRTTVVSELFTRDGARGRIVVVTGAEGPSSSFADVERASVVRVGSNASSTHGILIAATDAVDFSRKWLP